MSGSRAPKLSRSIRLTHTDAMKPRKYPIDWPRTLLGACRTIETSTGTPSLATLAAGLGTSASELQRQFTRRLGISPRQYAQSLKLHRLTRQLSTSGNTLDAVFNAGFESVTSAYNSASRQLGTSPGRLREPIAIGWWLGMSDLGWMLMAATHRGICWLAFGEAPGAMLSEMRAAFPKARFSNDEARLAQWFDQVREFVLLPREALELPIDVQGTAFQAGVWKVLRTIPLGSTLSYSDVAAQIGNRDSVRAVASACARNTIAVLIPCHRVLARDGRLAGYRWGIERKDALLAREQEAGNAADVGATPRSR